MPSGNYPRRVRRRDGEPERSDAATPARSRATGRRLLPLVVAGAAVVVLSTAVGGRPTVVSPFGGGSADGPPQSAPPAPTSFATPPAANPLVPAVSSVVQTVLVVLVSVVALAVAVLLIRLLVGAIRDRRRRVRLRVGAVLDAGLEPEAADAPTVLRGIAAALGALDEDREPGDAVVRAWLGLQQAAEDAGLTRSPAETPTEFTGRVLSRTGTDRAALRTLLGLYLRARFGDDVIAAADAVAAREALQALAASWEQVRA